jgi:O-antigen ligase
MQASLSKPSLELRHVRLCIVALLAGSVGISVAAIGLFKLLAFLAAITVLLIRPAAAGNLAAPLASLRSPWIILLALLCFCLSLLWTTETLSPALVALSKHGKLLAVPVMVLLVRNAAEARVALLAYIAVETFVLGSSYAVALGFVAPWVSPLRAANAASVFSSYLDESIMAAGFAAICWHLRRRLPSPWGVPLAALLAAAALVNVLYVLPGRTGHVVALAMVSLALIWSLPRKYQWAAVLVPLIVVAIVALSSSGFQSRVREVVQESQAYSRAGDASTSSGLRLDFWKRSIQAISERPLQGFGVGSWNLEYLRLSDGKPPMGQAQLRNPHQEYLLWGVELGLPGVALLLAVLLSLYRDAGTLAPDVGHALKSLLVAGAIACLFNSALFDAVIGDYFCVLWGLLLAYGRTVDLRPQRSGAPDMAAEPALAN